MRRIKSFTMCATLYSWSISGEFLRMWNFTNNSREEFVIIGLAFKKREELWGDWLRHLLIF